MQPDDPGFTAWASTADVARFGYLRIPNPRIGDQSKEAISFLGNEAIKILDGEHYPRPDSSYSVGSLLDLWRVHLSDEQRSGLTSDQRFCLVLDS